MLDTDLRLVVDCASLAPSVHNTQPWRFRSGANSLDVRADRDRALSYLDPTGRQLHISCGAAIEFARIAVRNQGRACGVTLVPDPDDPDLLGWLEFGAADPPTQTEQALAAAMPRRYTDRSPYDGRPVPAEVVDDARVFATDLGVWIRAMGDIGERTILASILTHAEAAEVADPAYAAELAAWTRAGVTADGIPLRATGRDGPAAVVTDVPLRDFAGHGTHPHPGGDDDRPPVVVRDTLLLLGTETDTAADWLSTGGTLAWLLLRAAMSGLSAQPLGPAIDQAVARDRLRRELHLVGHPQFVLRMGYGTSRPRTGRRSSCQTLRVQDHAV